MSATLMQKQAALRDLWAMVDGEKPIFQFSDEGRGYSVYASGLVTVGNPNRAAAPVTSGTIVNHIYRTFVALLNGRTPASMHAELLLEDSMSKPRPDGMIFMRDAPEPVDVHRLLDQLIALGAKVQA